MPETIQPLWTHPARLEAERTGRKRFDPGYPCVNGHHAERFVGGRISCVECARINTANFRLKCEAVMRHSIMTREEAQSHGLTTYFSGEPCGRGHPSRRRTINARCVKCQQLGLYRVMGPEAEALEDQIADINARSPQ
jgi:hypothetical protein